MKRIIIIGILSIMFILQWPWLLMVKLLGGIEPFNQYADIIDDVAGKEKNTNKT